MLSYEDIYHAAGIMNPASGYGIHKVVEMLNSQRIRDLSKEVKRASILMALGRCGHPAGRRARGCDAAAGCSHTATKPEEKADGRV